MVFRRNRLFVASFGLNDIEPKIFGLNNIEPNFFGKNDIGQNSEIGKRGIKGTQWSIVVPKFAPPPRPPCCYKSLDLHFDFFLLYFCCNKVLLFRKEFSAGGQCYKNSPTCNARLQVERCNKSLKMVLLNGTISFLPAGFYCAPRVLQWLSQIETSVGGMSLTLGNETTPATP